MDDKTSCRGCRYIHKIVKHPWNHGIGKGTMNETMGYVCTMFKWHDWIYLEDINTWCEGYSKEIDLEQMDKDIDEVLKKETSESLTTWLKDKRKDYKV